MPSVQIKNVPEETHAVLRRRAADSHQSLQEYLLKRLVDEAATPSVEEVLRKVDARSGGTLSLDGATQLVRELRDRR